MQGIKKKRLPMVRQMYQLFPSTDVDDQESWNLIGPKAHPTKDGSFKCYLNLLIFSIKTSIGSFQCYY